MRESRYITSQYKRAFYDGYTTGETSQGIKNRGFRN